MFAGGSFHWFLPYFLFFFYRNLDHSFYRLIIGGWIKHLGAAKNPGFLFRSGPHFVLGHLDEKSITGNQEWEDESGM